MKTATTATTKRKAATAAAPAKKSAAAAKSKKSSLALVPDLPPRQVTVDPDKAKLAMKTAIVRTQEQEQAEAPITLNQEAESLILPMLQDRQRMKEEMDRLEEEIAAVNIQLLAFTEDACIKTMIVDRWTVTRYTNVSVTLSKDELLKNGVTANVIAASTKRKETPCVSVTERKEKKEEK